MSDEELTGDYESVSAGLVLLTVFLQLMAI